MATPHKAGLVIYTQLEEEWVSVFKAPEAREWLLSKLAEQVAGKK